MNVMLVAVVAALAVVGYLVVTVSQSEAALVEDEPPSGPRPGGRAASVGVVVTAIIQEEDSVIVAFAPPTRGGRRLRELPSRDWGAVTFRCPPATALEALESWQRSGEPLVLESWPDQQVWRLSDPGRHRQPLVMSAT
jgi:hypothetical protein